MGVSDPDPTELSNDQLLRALYHACGTSLRRFDVLLSEVARRLEEKRPTP